MNHTAKSLETRAIWIGINEGFPVFCRFCNELSSSPANHFSEGSPTLQLFSFIHHSQVLGRLCLLPQVQLLLSHNSSLSTLWPFCQSHPCMSSAFSWPLSAQSPFSHQLYLPKTPNKLTSRSAMMEKMQTKQFQSLYPHLNWLPSRHRPWAFSCQQLCQRSLWKPSDLKCQHIPLMIQV